MLNNSTHPLRRYVSPRRRAQRTLELLGLCCADKFPWQDHRPYADEEIRTWAQVQVTDDIREWDYGAYEGLTSAQIREQRKQNGEPVWDIWRDGCPGGEYVPIYLRRTGLGLGEREDSVFYRRKSDFAFFLPFWLRTGLPRTLRRG